MKVQQQGIKKISAERKCWNVEAGMITTSTLSIDALLLNLQMGSQVDEVNL